MDNGGPYLLYSTLEANIGIQVFCIENQGGGFNTPLRTTCYKKYLRKMRVNEENWQNVLILIFGNMLPIFYEYKPSYPFYLTEFWSETLLMCSYGLNVYI